MSAGGTPARGSGAAGARPPWRSVAAWLWALARVVFDILRRIYALALISLVLYLSWLAFDYLLRALVLPPRPPSQITEVPLRLDGRVLQATREEFPGLAATEHPRTPLAHYHRLDGWLQPDRLNDCTRSGCHNAMPHSRFKETRAFLNMHATSLHCGVCHFDVDQRPLPLGWYDLHSGQVVGPPALLRAYAWLIEHAPEAQPPTAPPAATQPGQAAAGSAGQSYTLEQQREITALMRGAVRAADNEPALDQLTRHIAAVRPESEQFRQFLAVARASLPNYFRGEYGAKIAVLGGEPRGPMLAHPETAQAVQRWLERPDSLTQAQRDELLAAVHPLRSDTPRTCTDCHRREDGAMDFAALGYPPQRVEQLVGSVLMKAIEDIAAGRPLYLPGFISPQE